MCVVSNFNVMDYWDVFLGVSVGGGLGWIVGGGVWVKVCM